MQRGVALLIEQVKPVRILAGGCYETAPVDCAPETQAFLNSVIEVEADCTPQEMHASLQAVEQARNTWSYGSPGMRREPCLPGTL